MSSVLDLVQSSDIYDCFEDNFYETDVLLEYLAEERITPNRIYREVRDM